MRKNFLRGGVSVRRKLGLGMRTIKTGVAIWLAFWVCDLLQFENSSLAAITTIVAVQPSIRSSMQTIKNQVIATFFGCILAVIVAYYFEGSYTAIAISAILSIMFCVQMKLKDSISLLLVTIIIIGQTPLDNFELAIVQRICMIAIGLCIGFLMNVLIKPQHSNRFYDELNRLRQDFEKLYLQCIGDLLHEEHMGREEMQSHIRQLRDEIQDVRSIYQYSAESRAIISSKKEDDEIYLERRMINAINSNLERLIEIHRSIILAPKTDENLPMRETIYEYLRFVWSEHQQIFDYLIDGKPLGSACNVTFDRQAEDAEKIMMKQLNEMENLQPLHYWNMLIEAERILYKCWSLVQVKRKILGEVAGELHEEDLYRLQ